MNQPLISIIIPTLNCREIIEGALATIANQTLRDVEVIISDGGSSDQTTDFAMAYLAEACIKATCIIQPDSSVYGSLNLAVSIAKGEWHYVLGSDDRLYDNDVLANVARTLRNTTADVCHGQAWNATANQLISCGEYTVDRFTKENICHQAIFYRTKAVRRLQMEYNERYRLLADWDYNLKLFAKCRFQYLPITVAIFSGSGKSSRGEDLDFRMDLESNIIKYFGLRVCYLLSPDCLAVGTSRRPHRGNRVLLTANRFFYPQRKLPREPMQ